MQNILILSRNFPTIRRFLVLEKQIIIILIIIMLIIIAAYFFSNALIQRVNKIRFKSAKRKTHLLSPKKILQY